ncbi:MAG: alpha-L-fucosidase [Prevotellaceae bacterium]|jgi:alpha-L-fucosidase|nr:alpha-L-fucosidase [Prevotellaceae bacterium]
MLAEITDLSLVYYLSPWDKNHPDYGTNEYNAVFANMLTEILTSYGVIFEQWFDGANGEGPNGKKQTYDWKLFNEAVYKNQPNAIIFSDVGPGCRWMGNEEGVAGETNWSRLNREGFTPGIGAPHPNVLQSGDIDGEKWIPAETDVSTRPGWFYSPATDSLVKTTEQLLAIYLTSVGRNSNLLLNVPPDRRGLIHPIDSARLMEFRDAREEIYSQNLATGAKILASNECGGSKSYAASNILVEDYDTYWATDDGISIATITIELPEKRTFNRLMLQEYIPLGQRVALFTVEYFDATTNRWQPLTEGITIGYKRILPFADITTDSLRISITNSLACPVLNDFGLYSSKWSNII